MGYKRIFTNGSELIIPDETAPEVVKKVTEAMESGKVVTVDLLSTAGRSVTLFLNGAATPSLVVDLDEDPKPSEISG